MTWREGIRRWLARRRWVDCPCCKNERVMLRYQGPRADLVSCSWCGTGEKLADTTIPSYSSGGKVL